jgi:hypothetical protein
MQCLSHAGINIYMTTLFPINIEPTGKWKVSKFHIDLPYTYDELLAEFENEDWVSPGMINNLGNDNWGATRFKIMNPKSENRRLTELTKFFRSPELKKKFVYWLYESDTSFQYDWEWTPDEMCEHTILHGEFSKDVPGFVNVLHTDFRKLVATGLVYYAKTDDPDISTVFHDDPNRTNSFRMTTNFGDGWLHANGNNTYHEGWNRTDYPRYSTLIGLTLNITKI